jgi:hypothetical protein
VEYEVGNVSEEVFKPLPPGVRKLVLCAHDESTMQANDGMKAGWGPEGEQPLLKKGPGWGSHRSDIICSTVGWLKEAGQQLEYGKNYDGYWTGELFVKQLSSFLSYEQWNWDSLQLKEKIIPAFEKAHGPEYQALFMVDNSQGHSAYPADALLAQWMNLGPGGKKPCMWDGWFMLGDQKVLHSMVMPNTDPNSWQTAPNLKVAQMHSQCIRNV